MVRSRVIDPGVRISAESDSRKRQGANGKRLGTRERPRPIGLRVLRVVIGREAGQNGMTQRVIATDAMRRCMFVIMTHLTSLSPILPSYYASSTDT